MGFKHKRNILLERERETKRKQGKRDGREERNNFLYYLIGLYVKIKTKMLSVLLNELVK